MQLTKLCHQSITYMTSYELVDRIDEYVSNKNSHIIVIE